jgi:GNAT superfamily N-acetyltransferase
MDHGKWALLASEAFGLPAEVEGNSLFQASSLLPGVTNLGFFDEQSRWIACAQIAPARGVALFGNDATLPEARERGAQSALIHDRLRRASAMGLRWAVAEVAPDSGSERNYLRAGFHLLYARTHYVLHLQ